ncbi:MAG: HAD family phosphatase [Spirochaetales bacterium]|nr:HAD family phosphatase [Spirochaetales bacterium]
MNIIFDLGGVVFDWNPEELLCRFFPDPDEREKAREKFMKHPDWIELDRGALSPDEAISRAAERTGLPRQPLKELLDATPASLKAKEDTFDLILRLKERGHSLYILSNMHHDSMDYLDETQDIFELFDGKVASCRVGMVKPEEEIFLHILKEYGLNPADTVFIDDMLENVEAASRKGIHPLRFESAKQCTGELVKLGCL